MYGGPAPHPRVISCFNVRYSLLSKFIRSMRIVPLCPDFGRGNHIVPFSSTDLGHHRASSSTIYTPFYLKLFLQSSSYCWFSMQSLIFLTSSFTLESLENIIHLIKLFFFSLSDHYAPVTSLSFVIPSLLIVCSFLSVSCLFIVSFRLLIGGDSVYSPLMVSCFSISSVCISSFSSQHS